MLVTLAGAATAAGIKVATAREVVIAKAEKSIVNEVVELVSCELKFSGHDTNA